MCCSFRHEKQTWKALKDYSTKVGEKGDHFECLQKAIVSTMANIVVHSLPWHTLHIFKLVFFSFLDFVDMQSFLFHSLFSYYIRSLFLP